MGASAPYRDSDILSIYTGRDDQWAYSPSFTGRKLIASANIALTGSRKSDYTAAEALTKKQHSPRVTVWHHVYNFDSATGKCTMQLVKWDHHVQTIPHLGGCQQYSEHYGVEYRLTPPAPAPPLIENIPAYSAGRLEFFSLWTGLRLTKTLRRFYNGDARLNHAALDYAARRDFPLDAILPLTDSDGASVAGVHRLWKGLTRSPRLKEPRVIGISACGDFFVTDDYDAVWFYDHETGQYCATDLSLKDLME